MKLSKIYSVIRFNETFSFIQEELKFKIIEKNKYLNKRFDILINIKRNFCKEKIKYYEFNYINEYFNQFKNDLQNIIKEEEIKELFFYGLSKNENFYLKLSDKDFNLLIDNNPYFENNLNIEIDKLTKEIFPKYLLFKENKLTDKALKIIKEIFDSFSTDGKISKIKILDLMNKAFNENMNYQNISNIFSSYLNNNDLYLEGFYQFYFDILCDNKISEKIMGYLYGLKYHLFQI